MKNKITFCFALLVLLSSMLFEAHGDSEKHSYKEGVHPDLLELYTMFEKASLHPLYAEEVQQYRKLKKASADGIFNNRAPSFGKDEYYISQSERLKGYYRDLVEAIRGLTQELILPADVEVSIGWVVQLHQLYLFLTQPRPEAEPYRNLLQIIRKKMIITIDTGVWDSFDFLENEDGTYTVNIVFDEDDFNYKDRFEPYGGVTRHLPSYREGDEGSRIHQAFFLLEVNYTTGRIKYDYSSHLWGLGNPIVYNVGFEGSTGGRVLSEEADIVNHFTMYEKIRPVLNENPVPAAPHRFARYESAAFHGQREEIDLPVDLKRTVECVTLDQAFRVAVYLNAEETGGEVVVEVDGRFNSRDRFPILSIEDHPYFDRKVYTFLEQRLLGPYVVDPSPVWPWPMHRKSGIRKPKVFVGITGRKEKTNSVSIESGLLQDPPLQDEAWGFFDQRGRFDDDADNGNGSMACRRVP